MFQCKNIVFLIQYLVLYWLHRQMAMYQIRLTFISRNWEHIFSWLKIHTLPTLNNRGSGISKSLPIKYIPYIEGDFIILIFPILRERNFTPISKIVLYPSLPPYTPGYCMHKCRTNELSMLSQFHPETTIAWFFVSFYFIYLLTTSKGQRKLSAQCIKKPLKASLLR